MKSIEAILNIVSEIVKELRESYTVDIALGGGYAVISHGVGRTTLDLTASSGIDIITRKMNEVNKLWQ